MEIRTFKPDDESRQAAIYNAAAADLPKFKPASAQEILRRTRAKDFDPTTRFYAEKGGQVVGYSMFNPNGRVSYPWCLKGHESAADPLFKHVLQTMKERGFRRAFAAYRGDWPGVRDFFLGYAILLLDLVVFIRKSDFGFVQVAQFPLHPRVLV